MKGCVQASVTPALQAKERGSSLAALCMEEGAGHKGWLCRAGAGGRERTLLGMKGVGKESMSAGLLDDLLCFSCPQNTILAAPEVGVRAEQGEQCQGKVLSYD